MPKRDDTEQQKTESEETMAESKPATPVAPKSGPAEGDWDLEVRPHHAIVTVRIVAAVLAAIFIFGGIVLRHGSTGVNFRVSDQIGLALFGIVLAGAVLTLTRPRVRVGKRGVMVRNIVGDSEFQWKDIRGISFPDKKSWARLELAHDEYVPMMAIRSNDKMRAAEAMDRFRELGAKYTAEKQD
ncbi:PH domain-containing protein [Nocardia sp. CDC153]|uniref:PH domain-containing protein n=1 Tax=Nocardia sp. CDC153 TaxID=3112167 RepID=UPI002DC038D2|nr:PH domain-containing protein [Nocardia sp. CDC153]MEC3953394.1 PH domain-containing protein [Nocardia sp. CDC153]